MVSILGAKIQLLDLPGIIEGAKDGKGRGKQVIAVARTCSMILLVLDVQKPLQHKKLIEYELEGFGIRLNKQPPPISFKKVFIEIFIDRPILKIYRKKRVDSTSPNLFHRRS